VAFTDSQLAYYRSKLGTTIDLVDLQARYDRLEDDRLVAAEVLDQRVADSLLKPLSFTIPGEYSEDRSKNLDLLTARAREVGVSVVKQPDVTGRDYR
jgi:hypothetical protein